MAFYQDFLREGGQQITSEAISNILRTASQRSGASTGSVVTDVLKEIVNPNGQIMQKARSIPGFTYALMGTFVNDLLTKTRILDHILPDDVSPLIRDAKALLQISISGMVSGIFSGIRDAVQDISRLNRQIETQVQAQISDASVPPTQRQGEYDLVVVIEDQQQHGMSKGLRDANGQMRRYPDGYLMAESNLFQALRAQHERLEDVRLSAVMARMGGGSNRNNPTPAELARRPFRTIGLLFEDAVRLGYAQFMSQGQMDDVIRSVQPKTPVDPWISAGTTVRQLFVILGASLGVFSRFVYDWYEKIIKQVADGVSAKGANALLKEVAERYVPQAVNGKFSAVLVKEIITQFDTNFGSELKFWDKMQLRAADLWVSRRSAGAWPKFWAYVVMLLVLYSWIFFLVLAVLAATAMLWGAFLIDYSAPITVFFFGHVSHAGTAAGFAMLFGVFVFTILLTTFKFWQVVLNPLVVKLLGARQDWLVANGWRLTFAMTPIFAFIVGAFWLDSSVLVRGFILVLALVSLSREMAHQSTLFSAQREIDRLRQQRTLAQIGRFRANYAFMICLGILLLEFALRHGWHSIAGSAGAEFSQWFFDFLSNDRTVATVLRLMLAMIVGFGLILLVESRLGRNWMVRTIVVLSILAIGAFPWLDRALGGQYSHASSPVATTSVVTSVPIVPVSVPSSVSAPAVRTKRVVPQTHTHSHPLRCERLSPTGRIAAGCP